ncbi:MAG: hypothetical protein KDE35_07860 [Geminicoccaceae bacterium]|nr:hypothetical protein [Geminicoccaceae bacterium]
MEWWIALSEIVRNFALVAAGAVGLLLAGLRVAAANRQADAALRQTELQRRDHVAELFNRAVGQLHDDELHVRLGAVYTLRQIANDFPDLTGAVFELLSLYVRDSGHVYGEAGQPDDIRIMLDILFEQPGKR